MRCSIVFSSLRSMIDRSDVGRCAYAMSPIRQTNPGSIHQNRTQDPPRNHMHLTIASGAFPASALVQWVWLSWNNLKWFFSSRILTRSSATTVLLKLQHYILTIIILCVSIVLLVNENIVLLQRLDATAQPTHTDLTSPAPPIKRTHHLWSHVSSLKAPTCCGDSFTSCVSHCDLVEISFDGVVQPERAIFHVLTGDLGDIYETMGAVCNIG
jgi:hypothetical protein